jgi:hypothetical protein
VLRWLWEHETAGGKEQAREKWDATCQAFIEEAASNGHRGGRGKRREEGTRVPKTFISIYFFLIGIR